MKRALCLGVALLALAWVADACAAPALHAGAFELRTRIAATRDALTLDEAELGTRTNVDGALYAGVSLTSWFGLGASFLGGYESWDPESEATAAKATDKSWDRSSYGVIPEVTLNLAPSSNVVPYLAAGGGIVFYSGDWVGDESATVLPRVELGLRWFVTEAASLNFSAVYSRWSNLEGVKEYEADRIGFGVGISLFP
jgi:hypothetical protein